METTDKIKLLSIMTAIIAGPGPTKNKAHIEDAIDEAEEIFTEIHKRYGYDV